jgi:hypothetical protein
VICAFGTESSAKTYPSVPHHDVGVEREKSIRRTRSTDRSRLILREQAGRVQQASEHSPESQPSKPPSPHHNHKHNPPPPPPASLVDIQPIDTGRAIACCFIHTYKHSLIKGKAKRTNRCINLGLVDCLFDRLLHRWFVSCPKPRSDRQPT